MFARILLFACLLLALPCHADHLIVSGGPALRNWENLRTEEDQHDRWWGNFIRSATLRMVEIRRAYGTDAALVWFVYQPGYLARGREDGKPYATWITELAAKRRVKLIWFSSGSEFIQGLNAQPGGSIQTFDYFGHSNRHAFMFDYGNGVAAASTAWFHERDLPRIKPVIFSRTAYCKSWGCHTGESMSAVWERCTGVPLEGANGATDYSVLHNGQLPTGNWIR